MADNGPSQADLDRKATLEIVDRFCAAKGFDRPALREIENGGEIAFVGSNPDGGRFSIGYEAVIGRPSSQIAR